MFTGRDERTYLFAGDRFVVFDNRHRWWSEPKSLRTDWDSIPFDRVDAAFLGSDGKTYVFRGGKYVRYSGDDYTRVDDRYPKARHELLGQRRQHHHPHRARRRRARGAVARGGRGRRRSGTHTYLFSGGQYVRYEGTDYATVDDGYPRDIATSLAAEPRFANLTVPLDGGSTPPWPTGGTSTCSPAARCHVVSSALYRSYDAPRPAPRAAAPSSRTAR